MISTTRWFRDLTLALACSRQLLGEASDDIDIALDNNMTGQDFCHQVNKYLEWIGEEQKTVCVSQRYAICIALITLTSNRTAAMANAIFFFCFYGQT
jgi:hypothetical protein